MASCMSTDDFMAKLAKFASISNAAFEEQCNAPTLTGLASLVMNAWRKGIRFGVVFRELAYGATQVTAQGAVDLSSMPASQKLDKRFGKGAHTKMIEAASTRSLELIRELEPQLPQSVVERLLVLHDPRNPDHVKEGVTCESIKGLKWLAKRLLTHVDMVSHVGPGGFKGIEPLANVDHAWSKNGEWEMPFFAVQPAATTTTELLDTLRLQGGEPPLLKHVTLPFNFSSDEITAALQAEREVLTGIGTAIAEGGEQLHLFLLNSTLSAQAEARAKRHGKEAKRPS